MINLHHSIDFKLSAVKLYLKMKSIREVANLLDCKKSSLQRWIVRYLETGSIERKENSKRKSIITTDILNFIKELIKINPAITLSKIKKKIFKKFNTDISTSYLFYIGGGESPTFTTSNSEEESKIKFYFLLRHYQIYIKINT